MENSTDTLTILSAALVILLVIGIFIWLTIRIRRGGGSLTTIGLGATHEFLTKDRRKAAEVIVNQNAGKELESQSSAAPKNPDPDHSKESLIPPRKSREDHPEFHTGKNC